jgi:hypothetical protein
MNSEVHMFCYGEGVIHRYAAASRCSLRERYSLRQSTCRSAAHDAGCHAVVTAWRRRR